MHFVYCVAFWFTRRADIFRGFFGNPKDMKLGSITQMVEERRKPTNGFVSMLEGTRED
jgi:hypothetical protein